MPPLPPVELAGPGWTIQHGQAVWTAPRATEGVAGELLLATRADGDCFVQFSKPPFTLATAQAGSAGWRWEVPATRTQRGGRGEPPGHCVWFALAAAAAGQALPPGWQFTRQDAAGWRLSHVPTGETLEGFFSP